MRRLAGARVEPQWDQLEAMSRRWSLSVCPCSVPGADAICACVAKVVKVLVRGMPQNFAFPFRDRQRAQPLRGGALLESLWPQPAAIGGPVPRRRLRDLALTFRHRRQAVQLLRLPAGAQVESRWHQQTLSGGRCLVSRVRCALGADAVCPLDADAVKELVLGML